MPASHSLLGIYLRGLAMGVAEVIPGVSGGTIAFVTGIYRELIHGIASFGGKSVRILWRDGWRAFWDAHDLRFLVPLGAGMATSLLLLARLIHWLLDAAPIPLWSFFFGLVIASSVDIGRQNTRVFLLTWGSVGAVIGATFALAVPADLGAGEGMLFLGGMLAVTAWLLPGVSGSYVLLMLGLYEIVIGAVAELNLAILGVVAAGAVLSLLIFARLLEFALARFHFPIMALLTGFMAGSLLKLWPWRVVGADGAEMPVTPRAFQMALEVDPQILAAGAAALVGVCAVVLLARSRPPES
jgi:putative membrane protein